jgi:hypothetical protein
MTNGATVLIQSTFRVIFGTGSATKKARKESQNEKAKEENR